MLLKLKIAIKLLWWKLFNKQRYQYCLFIVAMKKELDRRVKHHEKVKEFRKICNYNIRELKRIFKM